MTETASETVTHVDLKAEYEASGVASILDELENELIGLQPVKQRIREVRQGPDGALYVFAGSSLLRLSPRR